MSKIVTKLPFLSVGPLALVACAACAEGPPPAVCPTFPPPVAVEAKAPPTRPEPHVRVRLEPRVDPAKVVHVDIELVIDSPPGLFRLVRGSAEGVTSLTLTDPAGAIPVTVALDGDGIAVTPSRSPNGVTHLSYDVAANTESRHKALSLRVLDDRFVGSGEGLVMLPESLLDRSLPIELGIDGAKLKAPNAASTWGLGAVHRTVGRPRALQHLAFVAGSLGAAEFDTSEGHDEDAWLGYTAFDARPVAAEVAGTRTAMAELFHGEPLPNTVLFVSQAQAVGSYTTTPRVGGVLVQLGPGEPWSPALRVSVGQQLVRPWIGGELWIGPQEPGHLAESYWFTEGVARLTVTRLLARTGILRPEDVRDVLSGATSAILASPYRGVSNVALAAKASLDPIARAHLVARGTLYAARINALVREKSKEGFSIDTLLTELLEQARREKKALPASAWVDAVVRALGPEEREMFAKTIEKGEEVVLPRTVLGKCFRTGVGDYVAWDLGFDGLATREGKTGEVVGLVAGGPAARAGVRPGDIVDAEYREGHSEIPVKLTITRGKEQVKLSYLPAGAHQKGPIWTRVAGIPDEKCTDAY